jgi:putative nucleotidyltransferase with HDIG domain
MYTLEGKDFFDNIRRSVKLSHFVASFIPLALLVYFSIKYVIPYVTEGNLSTVPLNIGIVLVLAVVLSVLGLVLSTKATNSSIGSAQDLNRKIDSLFEITKQFRETMYLDILLENIMKSAMNLTSAELGALLLYDEEGRLKIRVISGKNSEKMKNRVIKPGEGIAAQVAEKGKAFLVNDVSRDNRYNPEFDRETGYHTRSIICVPLICSNETIGVIELRNREQGIFTEQDEALLHSLADQASISIAQNSLQERQKSDFIHVTEILVGTQDHIQNKKGHARRVAHYANLIGKELGISEAELKKLYYASLFHDIGFMKIDMSEQWDREMMMNHSRLGYEMIRSISLWKDSADIILFHHERYDGNGYPMAKKEEEIPLGARILFVADTYDALTSEHSYKKPLDKEAALEEIEANAGTQFDPAVVQAFTSALSEAGLINT